MNLSEATRQYQNVLEAQRRARTEHDGMVSMLDELDDGERELERSARNLWNAWMNATIA